MLIELLALLLTLICENFKEFYSSSNLPDSFYTERFGFIQVLDEISKRIDMLDRNVNFSYDFNEVGILIRNEQEMISDLEVLNYMSPYVIHNALNIM